MNVEIRCRKTLLLKKRVFGYEKLILNDTKYGERYVLKVETASVDETHRVRSVEVSTSEISRTRTRVHDQCVSENFNFYNSFFSHVLQ